MGSCHTNRLLRRTRSHPGTGCRSTDSCRTHYRTRLHRDLDIATGSTPSGSRHTDFRPRLGPCRSRRIEDSRAVVAGIGAPVDVGSGPTPSLPVAIFVDTIAGIGMARWTPGSVIAVVLADAVAVRSSRIPTAATWPGWIVAVVVAAVTNRAALGYSGAASSQSPRKERSVGIRVRPAQ
jgi:hypothetical protein